jgi:demethylspheroidene O-methyltransferase
MLADDIIDCYPFARHRRILDVGGGEGEFLMSLARRVQGPSLQLFDLPAVSARAAVRISEAGLSQRITTSGGSFLDDALPGGCDAITLVRVVHDHDDARVLQLLANVRRALAPGGTVVIAEPMADAPDSGRVADVYFAFYLLAMGSGRPRSAAEITRLLKASGFGAVHSIATARPMLVSMLVATSARDERHKV